MKGPANFVLFVALFGSFMAAQNVSLETSTGSVSSFTTSNSVISAVEGLTTTLSVSLAKGTTTSFTTIQPPSSMAISTASSISGSAPQSTRKSATSTSPNSFIFLTSVSQASASSTSEIILETSFMIIVILLIITVVTLLYFWYHRNRKREKKVVDDVEMRRYSKQNINTFRLVSPGLRISLSAAHFPNSAPESMPHEVSNDLIILKSDTKSSSEANSTHSHGNFNFSNRFFSSPIINSSNLDSPIMPPPLNYDKKGRITSRSSTFNSTSSIDTASTSLTEQFEAAYLVNDGDAGANGMIPINRNTTIGTQISSLSRPGTRNTNFSRTNTDKSRMSRTNTANSTFSSTSSDHPLISRQTSEIETSRSKIMNVRHSKSGGSMDDSLGRTSTQSTTNQSSTMNSKHRMYFLSRSTTPESTGTESKTNTLSSLRHTWFSLAESEDSLSHGGGTLNSGDDGGVDGGASSVSITIPRQSNHNSLGHHSFKSAGDSPASPTSPEYIRRLSAVPTQFKSRPMSMGSIEEVEILGEMAERLNNSFPRVHTGEDTLEVLNNSFPRMQKGVKKTSSNSIEYLFTDRKESEKAG
ncbi:hypothetical protein HK096_004545 [Nowakowskiella sp. JEL0078]|nr:hypothetical protein HK096_004545 [Nowakowskiella sp. JEL0078]